MPEQKFLLSFLSLLQWPAIGMTNHFVVLTTFGKSRRLGAAGYAEATNPVADLGANIVLVIVFYNSPLHFCSGRPPPPPPPATIQAVGRHRRPPPATIQ